MLPQLVTQVSVSTLKSNNQNLHTAEDTTGEQIIIILAYRSFNHEEVNSFSGEKSEGQC